MYSYSFTQWILFFFFYCFLGWIWECFYVSLKKSWEEKSWKFVNRGFLHGPLIPIYGFAAITILPATLQVRDNLPAVYVVGALTATLFEIVTGTVMEKLFKVKYWDYSNMPLNYKGHICFFVSLVWGFFALLLVRGIHPPAEKMVLGIPENWCDVTVVLLVAVTVHDASAAFNEAMDLRELMETLAESNEIIQRLERRFNAVIAFAPIADREELRDRKTGARERVLHNIERLRWRNEQRLNRIREYVHTANLGETSERKEIIEKLEMHKRRLRERSDRQFLRAVRQIKRNPGVKSEKYQEILETLKGLLENNKQP